MTYTGDELISAQGKVPLATADASTEVLARLTFPDFPVGDETHYASIHSNPPGLEQSPYSAVTLHHFGRGQCLWIATPLLRIRQFSQQNYLRRLLADYLPVFVEAENLPASAEITLLKSQVDNQYLLCIVNAQDELPVLPLYHVRLIFHLPVMPRQILRVGNGQALPFHQCADGTTEIYLEHIAEADFLAITP